MYESFATAVTTAQLARELSFMSPLSRRSLFVARLERLLAVSLYLASLSSLLLSEGFELQKHILDLHSSHC